MKLSDDSKKYILNRLLENIADISDKEYQKRKWIRGEGPEGTDFDETVCHFFDAGDPLLEDYKEFDITENQYKLLKIFRDEFETFNDDSNRGYLPDEFIDTPEWDKVTKRAKEVLRAFNFQKKSI